VDKTVWYPLRSAATKISFRTRFSPVLCRPALSLDEALYEYGTYQTQTGSGEGRLLLVFAAAKLAHYYGREAQKYLWQRRKQEARLTCKVLLMGTTNCVGRVPFLILIPLFDLRLLERKRATRARGMHHYAASISRAGESQPGREE
jgi:hypothetical protein